MKYIAIIDSHTHAYTSARLLYVTYIRVHVDVKRIFYFLIALSRGLSTCRSVKDCRYDRNTIELNRVLYIAATATATYLSRSLEDRKERDGVEERQNSDGGRACFSHSRSLGNVDRHICACSTVHYRVYVTTNAYP